MKLFSKTLAIVMAVGATPYAISVVKAYDGFKEQFVAIEEAIRAAQFIRNKCLRLWMDSRGINKYDLQVIHRDIKPENIIRHVDGQLVLVDFGAAKQVSGSSLSGIGTRIFTQGYTAPEQAAGKALPASDIYGLGVTCIHLLTGVEPLELLDTDGGEWVWRNYLKSKVSHELGQILDKMIARDVKQRYQTAAEVLEALQKLSVPREVPLKYSKLKELLAAKKWEEANRETANVVLQVAGRKKEGWLDSDSINNFPYDDYPRRVTNPQIHF